MRQIFQSIEKELFFRQHGYVVFDLLESEAMEAIYAFYASSFQTKREVLPFAQHLPYYISIFDKDAIHKRNVDALISDYVGRKTSELMMDYEVFYSNFMIKFPGDGQIEAHQDFNFVDESVHTAFNLWCPLVDTDAQNGGLYVIPGSHTVFRTQRGPNLPKALTQFNQMLKRYARLVPLQKGQAIIFDHKLIHYSSPNYSDTVRLAIQSVLKPVEATACQYHFDEKANKVKAYRIDKNFILENDLWKDTFNSLPLDHEEEIIPFPSDEEVIQKLVQLKVNHIKEADQKATRCVFKDPAIQKSFEENGYVKLPVLNSEEVNQLKELFTDYSGGDIKNTDYGMYISLEEDNFSLKKQLIETISAALFPYVQRHFADCKPHLGSFLVKAPDKKTYTYPHQDWTFVNSPGYQSITVWIALVDTDETNGTLGFVKGSHLFFNKVVGSPSPEFQTCTQGHETIFYEYLDWVPLKAGEAVAFDNRTIHGAPPNQSNEYRVAVAIGMTPKEAQLYHFYLLPATIENGYRKIAKLKVDDAFFHRHSPSYLKELYRSEKVPEGYEVEKVLYDEYNPFSQKEIEYLCEQSGLQKNGKHLNNFQEVHPETVHSKASVVATTQFMLKRIWNLLFQS